MKKELKENLLKVINEDVKSIKLPFTPISEITEILESLGINHDYSDTNGWEIDFWYYYGDEKYVLTGSLEYGDMEFLINDSQ